MLNGIGRAVLMWPLTALFAAFCVGVLATGHAKAEVGFMMIIMLLTLMEGWWVASLLTLVAAVVMWW